MRFSGGCVEWKSGLLGARGGRYAALKAVLNANQHGAYMVRIHAGHALLGVAARVRARCVLVGGLGCLVGDRVRAVRHYEHTSGHSRHLHRRACFRPSRASHGRHLDICIHTFKPFSLSRVLVNLLERVLPTLADEPRSLNTHHRSLDIPVVFLSKVSHLHVPDGLWYMVE